MGNSSKENLPRNRKQNRKTYRIRNIWGAQIYYVTEHLNRAYNYNIFVANLTINQGSFLGSKEPMVCINNRGCNLL